MGEPNGMDRRKRVIMSRASHWDIDRVVYARCKGSESNCPILICRDRSWWLGTGFFKFLSPGGTTDALWFYPIGLFLGFVGASVYDTMMYGYDRNRERRK